MVKEYKENDQDYTRTAHQGLAVIRPVFARKSAIKSAIHPSCGSNEIQCFQIAFRVPRLPTDLRSGIHGLNSSDSRVIPASVHALSHSLVRSSGFASIVHSSVVKGFTDIVFVVSRQEIISVRLRKQASPIYTVFMS